MSGILLSFAIAWPGAASLPAGSAAFSGARLVDLALSLLFVLWLSRFAGRLQTQREAEQRDKVVPFPGPARPMTGSTPRPRKTSDSLVYLGVAWPPS
jgi:hypothetical protein